jgi:hypothetical protein
MNADRSADVPLRPGRRAGAILPAVLAVSAALLLLPGTGAAAVYAPHGSAGVSWTNGVVLCQFNATAPAVAVSALGMGPMGMSLGSVSLSEVAPNGSVEGALAVGGLSWTVRNLTSEASYALNYSVHAPMEAVADGPSVGSADVGVEFVLADDSGLPIGPTDTVEVLFSVANWSWQGSGDHLVLSFAAGANVPATERLAAASVAGWVVTSTSNASGSETARMGVNATAIVANGSAAARSVAAVTSVAMLSSAAARVTVAFAPSAGEFSSLQFAARVGIVLPATVAGIPIAELLAALLAGGIVSVGVAVLTRSVRRRPSKLVYVEEERS